MKLRRTLLITLPLFLAALVLAGCEGQRVPPPATYSPSPSPLATPATPALAARATPVPTPAPTPTVTPTPVPEAATLGFIGDIMIMSVQISGAKTEGGYDFSKSFAPLRAVFSSVDFLAGNFECTLAGEGAGYSLPRQTPPPATELDPTPKAPLQRFNAPDALAENLVDAGFDLVSTANNHSMDKGIDGLYRTARVLREAGLVQLGTYLDPADAQTPRVADIGGIRVGFVNAAGFLNSGVPALTRAEREYAILLLRDEERVASAIALCKEAGAEFVVALVHWGVEHSKSQNRAQEDMTDWLIAAGVDAIIGTHPHVVQPIEWREAQRGGEAVRVPVAYSLGNFLSNMAQKNVNYGLFVRLTLTRDGAGRVSCTELAYLPLLCYRDGGHAVKPCYAGETGESQRAFSHVTDVCAGPGITLIERGD